jgi:hypothetical protein
VVLLREFEAEGAVLDLNGQLQAQSPTFLFLADISVPRLAFPLPLFPFLNLQANHKNRWPARTGPQSRRLRFPPWTSVLDISDPCSSHAEHKTVTQHSRFPHANYQNRASKPQRASEHVVSPPLHGLRRATWPIINASRTRRRLASFGSER